MGLLHSRIIRSLGRSRSTYFALLVMYIGLRARSLRWRHRRRLQESLLNRSAPPQGGGFIRTSRGRVHYRYDGVSRGRRPLVVLVHGFTGCHLDLESLTRCLVSHGRRVLRFDNYGRGWTPLPSGDPPMTVELFAGQLAEVLHALGEMGPIDLAGYSMGGPITAAYAGAFGTARVRSLTLLSPAGLPSMTSGLRDLGQLCLYVIDSCVPYGREVLLYVARALFLTPSEALPEFRRPSSSRSPAAARYLSMWRNRLSNEPGLPHAFLDTAKVFSFSGQARRYGAVAAAGNPTLCLWGSKDGVCPAQGVHDLEAIYAKCDGAQLLVRVKSGEKHMFALEVADDLADDMVEFWDSLP